MSYYTCHVGTNDIFTYVCRWRRVKYLQLNTSHLLGGIKLNKEPAWSLERGEREKCMQNTHARQANNNKTSCSKILLLNHHHYTLSHSLQQMQLISITWLPHCKWKEWIVCARAFAMHISYTAIILFRSLAMSVHMVDCETNGFAEKKTY